MSIKWETIKGLDKALEKAVAQGLTSPQIARQLSHTFKLSISRCAVIGRAKRTGLILAGSKPKVVAKAQKPTKPASGAVAPYITVRKIIAPSANTITEPKPQGDFDHGCRFMYGDHLKKRNFCCAPKVLGSSWCKFHEGVCWDNASTRASAARMRMALAQKENLRERRI